MKFIPEDMAKESPDLWATFQQNIAAIADEYFEKRYRELEKLGLLPHQQNAELLTEDAAALKEISKLIAIAVRNQMEDFHCDHLTDEQMKELNPIIRNAIYSALNTLSQYQKSPGSEWGKVIRFHQSRVPAYWEEPELVFGVDEEGCIFHRQTIDPHSV